MKISIQLLLLVSTMTASITAQAAKEPCKSDGPCRCRVRISETEKSTVLDDDHETIHVPRGCKSYKIHWSSADSKDWAVQFYAKSPCDSMSYPHKSSNPFVSSGTCKYETKGKDKAYSYVAIHDNASGHDPQIVHDQGPPAPLPMNNRNTAENKSVKPVCVDMRSGTPKCCANSEPILRVEVTTQGIIHWVNLSQTLKFEQEICSQGTKIRKSNPYCSVEDAAGSCNGSPSGPCSYTYVVGSSKTPFEVKVTKQ